MYEIEGDIPVPKPAHKYPFNNLTVGQSFMVPYEDEERTLISNRVCTAARSAARTHTMKFTTRRTNIGVRVWRVS